MQLQDARVGQDRHPRGGEKAGSARAWLAGAMVALAATVAPAQDALRGSLAYDQAVSANQNPVAGLAPDRPHLGPVQLSLGGYVGADYVDNVSLAQSNAMSDEILHA